MLMQERNQTAYSSMLDSMVRQMVIATENLQPSPIMQYGNIGIYIYDLTFMQIILKKSEL